MSYPPLGPFPELLYFDDRELAVPHDNTPIANQFTIQRLVAGINEQSSFGQIDQFGSSTNHYDVFLADRSDNGRRQLLILPSQDVPPPPIGTIISFVECL